MEGGFIHGCVFYYWISRSDVSVIFLRMCLFSNHSFWPCCLWEISFSCQMIDKWNCQLVILAVGCWSWRELGSWSFGSGLF